MDVSLIHPFSAIISGPSGSGKTEFVCKLLDVRPFNVDIEDIVICYADWQDAYDRLSKKGCRFVQGMIDPDELDPKVRHLVIMDDLMQYDDKRIEQFFVRSCHHRNTSCFYIVQNLFCQSKSFRTCSLNCHYMILFKSPRDINQIRILEHQMYPTKKNYLVDSYNDACTSKPFGYIFLDLKNNSDERLRVRSRILEDTQDVYLPKDYKLSVHSEHEPLNK